MVHEFVFQNNLIDLINIGKTRGAKNLSPNLKWMLLKKGKVYYIKLKEGNYIPFTNMNNKIASKKSYKSHKNSNK